MIAAFLDATDIMPMPKKTNSEKKRVTKARKEKFERNHGRVYLKLDYFEKLQEIAREERLTVTEAAAVVIDAYCNKDLDTGRPVDASTPISSAFPATPGVRVPMTIESLPFFKSPLVPRCDVRKIQDDGKLQEHGKVRDHDVHSSSAGECSAMSGVEKMSDSDADEPSVSVTQQLQGASSIEDDEFNISVDIVEKGDYVYPQEKTVCEEEDNWHPYHNHNKSLCKGLKEILVDEEVFGEDEEGEEMEVSCSGLHHKITSPDIAAKTKLYIVTGSMLQYLARKAIPKCTKCHLKNEVCVTEGGTSAHIVWTCEGGHIVRVCMQETHNGSHVGDMKLASSILLSGNNFLKVKRLADFMNLHMFSSRLFNAIQNNYVCPVIEQQFDKMMADNRDRHRERDIVVCGDARNDSPGFNAQYCTYTLMDHESKDIVAAEFVDKREVGDRSGAMEPAALLNALNALKSNKIKVAELVTDAHPTISLILKRDYPEVIHSWDVWHGAKNIGKKISKASTIAAHRRMKYWTKHVVNHFWFCAETCNGDEDLFLSKWRGLVHHVANVHDWDLTGGLGGVPHCEHGPLEEREEWLVSGTKAHDALVKIVLDKRLLNTIVKFVNFRHTGELESLHSHILMYCSKRFSFGYRVYRARNMLAMLDYNLHKDRPMALDSEGNPKCRSRWSKHSASWVVHDVRVGKTYTYIPVMMEEILRCRLTDSRPLFRPADPLPTDPRLIRPRLAPVPPPPMEELKKKRKSRFST